MWTVVWLYDRSPLLVLATSSSPEQSLQLDRVTVPTVECLNEMHMQPVVCSSTFGCFPPFCLSLNISPWNFANWSFVPFVRIPWCASNSRPYSFFTHFPPHPFPFLSLPPPSFPSKLLAFVLLDLTDLLLPLYFANGFHMWRTRHFAWKCSRLLVGPIKKTMCMKECEVFLCSGPVYFLPFLNMNFYLCLHQWVRL